MSDLNTITLLGRVGKEPEFKTFDSGAMLTKFNLGCKRYDPKTKGTITDWVTVKTFSKLGEYVDKGLLVGVNGRLQVDQYQDKEGNNRSFTYVMADNIQLLTPKKSENAPDTMATETMIDDDEVPF